MHSVTTLMEWKTQGRAEAPYELTGSIHGMTDIDQLGRWFESALVAPTTDHFRIMANDADARAPRK